MEKIEQDNRLIAEFMEDITSLNDKVSFNKNCSVNELKYKTSWDWLMPVVEKINTMDDFNYSVSINYHYTSITDNNTLYDIVDVTASDTKEGCYKAVVEFINFYNKNKNENKNKKNNSNGRRN